MFKFEDKEFSGPLAEFLENCKPHRVEAIYNTEYKYIKEIIWDTEAQDKFGSTREGYEKFQKDTDYPGGMSYSGQIDLRIRTNREGEVLGYMTESKRTNNDNFDHMLEQYNLAREKLYEILEVKDKETFNYWLEEEAPFMISMRMGANETITAIENLENIVIKYNDEDHIDFKQFIDKIKV